MLAVLLIIGSFNPASAKNTASGRHPTPATAAAPPAASQSLQVADPHRLPPRELDACQEPGDNLAPTMVVLPPGQFLMGSPAEDKEHQSDEGPRHWVTIPRPFAISRCEITRGQFRRFVRETKHQTAAEKSGGCGVFDPKSKSWNADAKAYWDGPGFDQDDSHPVVCVAFEDARAYADWLSRRTGALYRLPSEAEWEYAARAGTMTSRFWGDDAEQSCGVANLADSERTKLDDDPRNAKCSDGFLYTGPVASFQPNQFGLYDMAGNVWEWTADCYHENYQGAPADGSAWEDQGTCDYGVVRGGSWNYFPQLLRSAVRLRLSPVEAGGAHGFRVVRAL